MCLRFFLLQYSFSFLFEVQMRMNNRKDAPVIFLCECSHTGTVCLCMYEAFVSMFETLA